MPPPAALSASAPVVSDRRLEVDYTLRDDVQTVKALVRNPVAALNTRAERQQAKDAFVNLAGASIGYLGLLGLRYPVSSYQQQVSDDLWRGSRVDARGVAELQQQGFRSIVSLCAESTKDEGPAKASGMGFLRVGIVDNTAPTLAQMKGYLDFVTNPKNAPAYVHCQAGRGRTGVAVACYRMAVEGWRPEQALAEAVSKGVAIPDQKAFILQFGQALAEGRIAGYPLQPNATP